MSSTNNPLLLPVTKDSNTIRETVLTNIVKMLVHRKWLDVNHYEKTIDELLKSVNDENLYRIKITLNLSESYTYNYSKIKNKKDDKKSNHNAEFDGRFVVVKLLPQKVTGINKSPIITEFLTNNKKYHKMLIVDSISDKAKNTLLDIPHTEVFAEEFFMQNLPDHECSPVDYEILDEKETEEMLNAYNVTKRKIVKILDNDRASLYYYLKEGQIVRIIRNSEISGKSVGYRYVVHRSLQKI